MLIADTASEIASLLLVRDIKKWNERIGRQIGDDEMGIRVQV